MNIKKTLSEGARYLTGGRTQAECDSMDIGIIDEREPSIVHFPSASICPVEDCQERGTYTNCYLEGTLKKCPGYTNYRSQEE